MTSGLLHGINPLSSVSARKDVHANYSTTGISGINAIFPLISEANLSVLSG
jgi:hypothetical protein